MRQNEIRWERKTEEKRLNNMREDQNEMEYDETKWKSIDSASWLDDMRWKRTTEETKQHETRPNKMRQNHRETITDKETKQWSRPKKQDKLRCNKMRQNNRRVRRDKEIWDERKFDIRHNRQNKSREKLSRGDTRWEHERRNHMTRPRRDHMITTKRI